MIATHLAASTGLSDLQQKLLVALVSAIIGASATLLVHFLKQRTEPRKRISWEASEDPGFAAIDDPEIQRKLAVTYDDVAVKNIVAAKYKVSNTGNRVIKDQRIRFSFPKGIEILEVYLSPISEPELKVERHNESSSSEVIYKIGHLEREQEVQFRFVVAGESIEGWKAVHHNEEGDVEVEKRGAAEKKEDRSHVAPFLASLFLFVTVPYSLTHSIIDEPIAEALATIIRTTILAYALLHLVPVTRLVRDTLMKSEASRSGSTINAVAHSSGTVLVLDDSRIHGGVELNKSPEDAYTGPSDT